VQVYRGCAFPDDLFFDVDQDVWVRFEDNGTVTCGMTDPAQARCGKLVAVSFRAIGKQVTRGRPLATVESGKWVGPFPAPLSGTIIATNEAAFARDILIMNRDPYDQGWLVRLRPTALAAERSGLLDAQQAFVVYRDKIDRLGINCLRCAD